MIEFVLALGMVMFVIFGGITFLAWAVREHIAAKKYRHLIKIYNEMPKGDQQRGAYTNKVGITRWEFTYREGNKRRDESIVIEAATEGLAAKKFMDEHRGAKVVSMVKL